MYPQLEVLDPRELPPVLPPPERVAGALHVRHGFYLERHFVGERGRRGRGQRGVLFPEGAVTTTACLGGGV